MVDRQRDVQDEQDEIAALMSEVGVSEDDVLKDVEELEAELANEGLAEVPSEKIKGPGKVVKEKLKPAPIYA